MKMQLGSVELVARLAHPGMRRLLCLALWREVFCVCAITLDQTRPAVFLEVHIQILEKPEPSLYLTLFARTKGRPSQTRRSIATNPALQEQLLKRLERGSEHFHVLTSTFIQQKFAKLVCHLSILKVKKIWAMSGWYKQMDFW